MTITMTMTSMGTITTATTVAVATVVTVGGGATTMGSTLAEMRHGHPRRRRGSWEDTKEGHPTLRPPRPCAEEIPLPSA